MEPCQKNQLHPAASSCASSAVRLTVVGLPKPSLFSKLVKFLKGIAASARQSAAAPPETKALWGPDTKMHL